MNLLDALYACRNYAETPDTDDEFRVHLLRSIAEVARAAIDNATITSLPDSRESLLAEFETFPHPRVLLVRAIVFLLTNRKGGVDD